MSLLLAGGALLALQSALPQGPAPDIVPGLADRPATPERTTQPLRLFRCRLAGDDGNSFDLTIRHAGERGYRDPSTGEIETTEPEVEVAGGPGNALRRYKFQPIRSMDYSGGTDADGAPFGSQVELRLSRASDPRQEGRHRFAIQLDAHWDWMPLTRGVGFCDLELSPQAPLSDAETRRYTAR